MLNIEDIILGTKVKCKGYIAKKSNIEYVYANKKHFKKDMGIFGDDVEEPKFYIEDLGEYLRINGESHNKHYFSKQIKSIVTKEQFNLMKYEIKRGD